MALFNKLFNRNNQNSNSRHECLSERLFAFNRDQIRLVLFRECDFRGRKLLFDSTSVKKVPIPNSNQQQQEETEKFTEISNGFGYLCAKPPPDCNELCEMVFGSVAMSFRGTNFKIHTLELLNKYLLMFSQVFPSPQKHQQLSPPSSSSSSSSHRNNSTPTYQQQHSNNYIDSGVNSLNSINNTTISDTILVCRRSSCNTGNLSTSTRSSTVGDSGYYVDNSFTTSSNPSSLGASNWSLSSGNLHKRYLRRTSTSLDNSGISLNSTDSIDDNGRRTINYRSFKLGFALIFQLTTGQEERLIQFLMEHVMIIETLLWRARHIIEIALIKYKNFYKSMLDMTDFIIQYLDGLLSNSYLSTNLWLLLSNNDCDRLNSINAFNNNNNILKLKQSLNNSSGGLFDNFGKFIKTDWDPFNLKRNQCFNTDRNSLAERFMQDFCDVLESVDIKDTNFFMSTLLTAVLTNHLGWVKTCLPSSSSSTTITIEKSLNPLWDELNDLYGTIGNPIKLTQTIITGGTNRNDLIRKILTILTYFIRCCDVIRKIPIRNKLNDENEIVEIICQKYCCIPKENYKKYEDHLKEIMNINNNNNSNNNDIFVNNKKLTRTNNLQTNMLKKSSKSLLKTQTCIRNLSSMLNDDTLDDFSSSTISNSNDDNVKDDVVFVLGDNEELVGLKTIEKSMKRPNCLNLSQSQLKPSTSWSSLLDLSSDKLKQTNCDKDIKMKTRSQSVPPNNSNNNDDNNNNNNGDSGDKKLIVERDCNNPKSKYRYSGVKFNLQQYPQILSNYMKSKNLEISNLQFGNGDKIIKIDELSSISDVITSKYPEINNDYNDDSEALQTPSNASELEFTSDLCVTPTPLPQQAKETTVIINEQSTTKPTFIKQFVPNTIIKENYTDNDNDDDNNNNNNNNNNKTDKNKMKTAIFPMPKLDYNQPEIQSIKYTTSLMRAINDFYMPDMVMQAIIKPKTQWESHLKHDLILTSQHSPIDQPVDEAIAIVANIDTWEVQLMSSHTFVIDKNSNGIPVGMSQLVANMLESLLQMWKLNVPIHYCLMHIEQTLQELCIRSKALAEFLLSSEFCNMEELTTSLNLEVNDVPLLLAVASTHSPQVTQKYGLSFQ